MENIPIAVQLYSLREESKTDFQQVLKKVAEIGYDGVEPAGFYGLTPRDFRRLVEDLGMRVSSSHTPWATPDNLYEVIDTASQLNLSTVACGYRPDDFCDLDAIKATADIVNGMIGSLAEAGLELFLHNHWWEFNIVAGKLAYDHFAALCPDARFELDTYWLSNFGRNDAAEQVAKFRDRTPLLHIKDGPLIQGEAMVAVGQGKMDIPAIIQAADPDVLKWLIVELDECDTDMLEALRESYLYLRALGSEL